MSMPTPSPFAADGLLYVGTGAQGDANRPFLAIKPGASGDISLKTGDAQQRVHRVVAARASPATRRRRSCTTAARTSCTTPGS